MLDNGIVVYILLTEMKQHSEQKEQHIAITYKDKINKRTDHNIKRKKLKISVVNLHDLHDKLDLLQNYQKSVRTNKIRQGKLGPSI